jgi:hypothetical protein
LPGTVALVHARTSAFRPTGQQPSVPSVLRRTEIAKRAQLLDMDGFGDDRRVVLAWATSRADSRPSGSMRDRPGLGWNRPAGRCPPTLHVRRDRVNQAVRRLHLLWATRHRPARRCSGLKVFAAKSVKPAEGEMFAETRSAASRSRRRTNASKSNFSRSISSISG